MTLPSSSRRMRFCQIPRQKSTYLRALSTAILAGELDLDKLPEIPVSEVRTQLKKIKGIGDRTTDIYLMFCLQVKDIFPIGDIAVVNTVRELTGAVSTEEIMEHSHRWKPYRSLATYFLWYYYLSKRHRSSVV